MTTLRTLARAWLPYEMRLRISLLRRAWRDWRDRTDFAARPSICCRHRFVHSDYSRPFIDYPGQESLAAAKRNNQRLLAAALDGAVLRPGQTFSLWRLAGRPRSELGYAPAAAIRAHRLVTELGGATCLLSTAVYNAALLANLEITERFCHSVDSYGPHRYFELGRDCAIVYGYRDLRVRNPHSYAVQLNVQVDAREVRAVVSADRAMDFRVELLVSEAEVERHGVRILPDWHLRPGQEELVDSGHDGLRTRTIRRVIHADGTSRHDDLGESVHIMVDRVVRRGVAPVRLTQRPQPGLRALRPERLVGSRLARLVRCR